MGKQKQSQVLALLFVPHTVGSKLAKELSEHKEDLERITGHRVKIVERAGNKLEDVLVESNPWKGIDCARDDCMMCETKQATSRNLKQSCSKRNATYQTWCETCQMRDENEEHEDGDGVEQNEADSRKKQKGS